MVKVGQSPTYMKGIDKEHGANRVAIKVDALSFLCLDLAQLLTVVHNPIQKRRR